MSVETPEKPAPVDGVQLVVTDPVTKGQQEEVTMAQHEGANVSSNRPKVQWKERDSMTICEKIWGITFYVMVILHIVFGSMIFANQNKKSVTCTDSECNDNVCGDDWKLFDAVPLGDVTLVRCVTKDLANEWCDCANTAPNLHMFHPTAHFLGCFSRRQLREFHGKDGKDTDAFPSISDEEEEKRLPFADEEQNKCLFH